MSSGLFSWVHMKCVLRSWRYPFCWHPHQLRFLDLLITGDVGPVELGYNYFPLEKLQVVERNIAIYEVRFDDEALYLALGVNEICFHVM